jgi:hypothetical protein
MAEDATAFLSHIPARAAEYPEMASRDFNFESRTEDRAGS